MTSLPGNPPSEFRRLTPCPAPSSLSPLAAPYTAGGRPLASDPIHNPASLGPTDPTMLHQSKQQMAIPADAFAFGSGSDVIGAGGREPPYYRQYKQWPTWSPGFGDDGSQTWIDPPESYLLPEGSAAAMSLNHYEQAQNLPTAPHANPLPNTHRIIENASPWKGGLDSEFFPIFSKVPRSSGKGPTLKEPSLDPFQNASRSSVAADHTDLLLTSVLNDCSDSFSLDVSSNKGYCGSTYDKYMPSRESTSTQSPTGQLSFGPGNGLVGGPTDRLVNCTSGFSPVQYGNPCRISMDYFDCLPHEQKNPVAYSTSNCAKVKIAAPIAKSPCIKGDNLVVESCGLDIKSSSGNAKPGKSGTGFALGSMVLEGLDEQNVGLDSPCWKGMPSSSQFIFSKTEANCASENEITTRNFFLSQTSQDKRLDPVAVGLVNSSEEKVKEQNKNQNLKPDNAQKNGSSDNNVKDEKSKGLASASLAGVVDPPTDVKLLIQSLCGLSHTLSTSFGDEFELTEHELELVQMSMENLKSFTGGRNKTDNDRPASSVKITDQISAGTDNRTGIEANYNQSNVGPQLADSIYKKSFSEAIDKIPEEDSELRAELYKNLWIEAEASLCTLKYELQLARAKLKMKSQNVHEANSSCSVSDPQPSSKMQNVDANTQTKLPLWDLNCGMPEEKDAGSVVDSAVMARLRIIKGRNTAPQTQSNGETSFDQNITMGHKGFSSSLSGAEKSIEKNITVQNKDISSSLAGSGDEVAHDEVDSDVMARWRVLQRRGDVGLNAESILPNYYSSGFAMEPRDLHPHAGSSEWEHVLKDELSPSGNSTMNG